MSESTWWIIMAGWAVGAVVTIAWIWWQVAKAEDALEAQANLDYDALMQVVGEELGRRQDLKKEAVVPISTAEFQEKMRKAESLGFLDNDWPRAS